MSGTITLDEDLILAVKHNNYNHVLNLICYGANVHYTNDLALLLAVKYQYIDIVRLLIHAGAKNTQALYLADERGYANIVNLLLYSAKYTNDEIYQFAYNWLYNIY